MEGVLKYLNSQENLVVCVQFNKGSEKKFLFILLSHASQAHEEHREPL